MHWIAIRMLTGDRQKFFGLVFGIAFASLLITQQMVLFVNLVERGASGVYNMASGDVFVMDPVSRSVDITYPMPSTALDQVRSTAGVQWAVPQIRASAAVRTAEGDLEQVMIVGVDEATLIGLPRHLLIGKKSDLAIPDTVFIDDVGAWRMFANGNAIGQRLELNDQRTVIRGMADTTPSFTSTAVFYTTYSRALRYVPGTRNRLSLILVGADEGVPPQELAARIAKRTGLKARTREQFAMDGIEFIIANTGIPFNFGITVALGFIVGVAIVGLTFSLFIRDNMKQFGALKAIGVSNRKIAHMVAAQAGMVGAIGYALGLAGTALFIWGFSGNPTFKGFYLPWYPPLISLVAVVLILAVTGWIALRSVMRTEPAAVFR